MDHNLNVHPAFFFFAGNGYLQYGLCLVSLFSLSVGCLSRVVCAFVCISADYLVVGRGSQGIFTKENPRNAGELGPTSIKAVQQECFYM